MSEWDSPLLEGVVHDVPTSMSPEIRDMWVEALRSGHWEQGGPYLRSADDKFSAEGVLADLAVFHGVVVWDKVDGEWFIAPYQTGVSLPIHLLEWAECEGMHGSQMFPLTYQGARHPIWRLEDHFKLTFAQIADLIEEQY